MINDIERVLFSEEEIAKRVQELTKQINDDYGDKPITAIFVLKGSAFFAADIIRYLKMAVTIEFMSVSSYGMESVTSGKLTIKKDLDSDINGKDVLIIEDIIDTGVTLSTLEGLLKKRGANSIKVVTMLSKPSRRMVDFDADYIGFEVPDEFVVGYGLDFADKYRNLPYIGALKRSIYEK